MFFEGFLGGRDIIPQGVPVSLLDGFTPDRISVSVSRQIKPNVIADTNSCFWFLGQNEISLFHLCSMANGKLSTE